MIHAGFYRARAKSAEFGTTPQKGTDFVRVVFAITEGEFQGHELTWDGYFTENTTRRTFDSLRYCGCTFPNNDPTDLTGLGTSEASIQVEIEEYEKDGQVKQYAKIAWVNSLTRGISPEAKMNDARKVLFKQRMMGQLMASKQSAGAAPTPAASTRSPAPAAPKNGTRMPTNAMPSPDPVDDIPF
jgi:hypothetical protein